MFFVNLAYGDFSMKNNIKWRKNLFEYKFWDLYVLLLVLSEYIKMVVLELWFLFFVCLILYKVCLYLFFYVFFIIVLCGRCCDYFGF